MKNKNAEQPAQQSAEQQTDWEAVAADQAMTIALLKAEQPAQQEEPVCIGWDDKTDTPIMGYTSLQPAQREDWGPGPHEYHSLPEPEQPAQQEPVAYLVDGDLYYPEEIDWETLQEQGHTVAALYTSLPAQRTWVGLTHDEYDAICDKHSSMSDFDFLEDIEIKLKEKNT